MKSSKKVINMKFFAKIKLSDKIQMPNYVSDINHIYTFRRIFKIWMINMGLPVLIIQILKIFGLILNTTLHNPPILVYQIIQPSNSSSSRFVNHPVSGRESSNQPNANHPVLVESLRLTNVNHPNFSYLFVNCSDQDCQSSNLPMVIQHGQS